MRRRLTRAGALLLGGWLVLIAPSAHAVITRLYPLRDALAEHEFISLARVETLAADKPAAVLIVKEDLKANIPFRRLPVNLTGDQEALKEKQPPQLLKRLAPDLPLVLFANQRGKRVTVFAYTNGTWFQMVGQKGDRAERLVLAFTHAEPYLRRTFKGTTAELRQVILDGLSGKKRPPEPNPKEPPGFGPEVPGKQSKRVEGGGWRWSVRGFHPPLSTLHLPPSSPSSLLSA